MDENMMKDNIESNSKRKSLLNDVIVHWKWDDERIHRLFLDLRYGGDAETGYDLETKYPEESEEQETVLIQSDKMIGLSAEEKISRITDLLQSEDWEWSPKEHTDFRGKATKLIG